MTADKFDQWIQRIEDNLATPPITLFYSSSKIEGVVFDEELTKEQEVYFRLKFPDLGYRTPKDEFEADAYNIVNVWGKQ